MFRAFIIALCLSLGIAPALADGVSAPIAIGPIGNSSAAMAYPPQSGGGPSYVAFTAPTPFATCCSTNLSFSSVPIGVGTVVLAVSALGGGAISAVVINGISASTACSTGNGDGLYYAVNSSGTSGTITFTLANSVGSAAIATGLLTGLNSSTPTATNCTPITAPNSQPYALSGSLTINSGGIGVVAGMSQSGTGSLPLSWTNATRDALTEASSGAGSPPIVGAAHMASSAIPSFNCNASNCNNTLTVIDAAAWR